MNCTAAIASTVTLINESGKTELTSKQNYFHMSARKELPQIKHLHLINVTHRSNRDQTTRRVGVDKQRTNRNFHPPPTAMRSIWLTILSLPEFLFVLRMNHAMNWTALPEMNVKS